MEILAGPIPGENFTSDTKNYPWHRPPEFDSLDKAIEYSVKKLTNQGTSLKMLTLMKNDVPVSAITEMFLMGGIMRGKWTVDYALLMAGPVSHILSMMAKASKIKYRMGIDDPKPKYTDAYFREMKKVTPEEGEAGLAVSGMIETSLGDISEEESDQPTRSGGFMAGAMTGNVESTPLESQEPSLPPPSMNPNMNEQGIL